MGGEPAALRAADRAPGLIMRLLGDSGTTTLDRALKLPLPLGGVSSSSRTTLAISHSNLCSSQKEDLVWYFCYPRVSAIGNLLRAERLF
mmetsp:Transcript_21828/g.54029  ORF Transcript_21828/g.54029 Transcript_21828/m.54029 type:complete len:89 (-) Transcript_21828:116-382(-)